MRGGDFPWFVWLMWPPFFSEWDRHGRSRSCPAGSEAPTVDRNRQRTSSELWAAGPRTPRPLSERVRDGCHGMPTSVPERSRRVVAESSGFKPTERATSSQQRRIG